MNKLRNVLLVLFLSKMLWKRPKMKQFSVYVLSNNT